MSKPKDRILSQILEAQADPDHIVTLTGPQGDKGDPGPRGPLGPQGAPGLGLLGERGALVFKAPPYRPRPPSMRACRCSASVCPLELGCIHRLTRLPTSLRAGQGSPGEMSYEQAKELVGV